VTFTTPMTAGAGNLSRSGSTLRSLDGSSGSPSGT
jgi:hypothetical protein